MYDVGGFSGTRITEEEFSALRDDEKGAIIQKIHAQMFLNAIDSGRLWEFVAPYLTGQGVPRWKNRWVQQSMESLWKRMGPVLHEGLRERIFPRKIIQPNEIAAVYMGRYEYWTPDTLRAAGADPSVTLLCEILNRDAVIKRCEGYAFDPNSIAAQHWLKQRPQMAMPPTGERIYTSVAKGLRETELGLRDMTVVVFTHSNGSSFKIDVDQLRRAYTTRKRDLEQTDAGTWAEPEPDPTLLPPVV